MSPTLQTAPSLAADEFTIYVLVRTDISLAQQIVQASHACAEVGRAHYREHHGTASLVLLAVADPTELRAAQLQLAGKAVRTVMFHEPDFQMGDSALATEPLAAKQRKYLRRWPLWRPTLPQPSAPTLLAA